MMLCSQDESNSPSCKCAQSIQWSHWGAKEGGRRHQIFKMRPWTFLSNQKSSNDDFPTEIANNHLNAFFCS